MYNLIEEIYDGQSSTASTMIRSDSPKMRPFVSNFLLTIIRWIIRPNNTSQFEILKRGSFWEISLCITKRIYKSQTKLLLSSRSFYKWTIYFKEKELIKVSTTFLCLFNLHIHSIGNDCFHKYSRYTALDTNEKIFGKQKQEIFLKTVNIFYLWNKLICLLRNGHSITKQQLPWLQLWHRFKFWNFW